MFDLFPHRFLSQMAVMCNHTEVNRGTPQVYEVDEGGQAHRKGVKEGYCFKSVGGVHVQNMDFYDIDALFDTLEFPIRVEFDTQVYASHLYAVELPAVETLAALAPSGGFNVH